MDTAKESQDAVGDAVRHVAILGAAGAIGHSVAEELQIRKVPFRVIGREIAKLESAFSGQAEIRPADINDVTATARALEGSDTVIYAVGLPYPTHNQHPVLMLRAVEAMKRAGVGRMALSSSVYGYGAPQTKRVSETHPREPQTRKGRYRKEQEDIALAANGIDGLRTLVLRLPDFYGPHATLSLADQVFQGALAGKTANWIGRADKAHEFVFVPDAGPVLLDLLNNEGSFGQAWNFGGPGTITGRELVDQVYRVAGREPKFRAAGPLALRIAGLFSPMLREMVEMHYLAVTPVILDDSKLTCHLGEVHKTPYGEGIRRTWDWYRTRERTAI
jgi:nucleoside-diphosphate-sugar epimerase